jgi:hypothetical protein
VSATSPSSMSTSKLEWGRSFCTYRHDDPNHRPRGLVCVGGRRDLRNDDQRRCGADHDCVSPQVPCAPNIGLGLARRSGISHKLHSVSALQGVGVLANCRALTSGAAWPQFRGRRDMALGGHFGARHVQDPHTKAAVALDPPANHIRALGFRDDSWRSCWECEPRNSTARHSAGGRGADPLGERVFGTPQRNGDTPPHPSRKSRSTCTRKGVVVSTLLAEDRVVGDVPSQRGGPCGEANAKGSSSPIDANHVWPGGRALRVCPDRRRGPVRRHRLAGFCCSTRWCGCYSRYQRLWTSERVYQPWVTPYPCRRISSCIGASPEVEKTKQGRLICS